MMVVIIGMTPLVTVVVVVTTMVEDVSIILTGDVITIVEMIKLLFTDSGDVIKVGINGAVADTPSLGISLNVTTAMEVKGAPLGISLNVTTGTVMKFELVTSMVDIVRLMLGVSLSDEIVRDIVTFTGSIGVELLIMVTLSFCAAVSNRWQKTCTNNDSTNTELFMLLAGYKIE